MQYSLFDQNNNYPAPTQPNAALWVCDSAGQFSPAQDNDILKAARNIADQVLPRAQSLAQPKLVKDFLRLKLNHSLEYEVFAMTMLNAQFELIEYLEPFRGTITQTSVYPREVVKIALEANACAIIIAHNHPSGALEPSQADKALTTHLRNALQLVDIRLLDHVIVARNQTLSFAEQGLL